MRVYSDQDIEPIPCFRCGYPATCAWQINWVWRPICVACYQANKFYIYMQSIMDPENFNYHAPQTETYHLLVVHGHDGNPSSVRVFRGYAERVKATAKIILKGQKVPEEEELALSDRLMGLGGHGCESVEVYDSPRLQWITGFFELMP